MFKRKKDEQAAVPRPPSPEIEEWTIGLVGDVGVGKICWIMQVSHSSSSTEGMTLNELSYYITCP